MFDFIMPPHLCLTRRPGIGRWACPAWHFLNNLYVCIYNNINNNYHYYSVRPGVGRIGRQARVRPALAPKTDIQT